MNGSNAIPGTVANTTHKVVLPFYIYAAVAFLASTVLLVFSTPAFSQHYFHPHTLAITHAMALGWGTMIILGASHQLVPVLVETKLYSNILAYISFLLAAIGIPLLVYAFYVFNIGWPAQCGGMFINAAVITYLANLVLSMSKSKTESVQSVFIFTGACWLLVTTAAGLLLVYNFAYLFLSKESLHYLSLHAHIGIIGWFLLLIIGVGSRLIPMFLISKYENKRLLWWIYACINGGLGGFVVIFIYFPSVSNMLPLGLVLIALILFGYYIYCSFRQRIRRKVDNAMKISLLSVFMTSLPVLVLIAIMVYSWTSRNNVKLVLIYGFTIFLGWITAIIFGMTFKTLPFIVWNKIYHQKARLHSIPGPKELFDARIFGAMSLIYIAGFLLFIAGMILANPVVIKCAAIFLLGAAVLYSLNVFKIINYKPVV